MVKVKYTLLIIAMLIISCYKDNRSTDDIDCYDIILKYNPQITINLNSGIIKANYGTGYFFVDTVRFLPTERKLIIDKYTTDISNIRGVKFYHNSKFVIMPPDDLVVEIYTKNRQVAKLNISYSAEKSKFWRFGERYHVLDFRDNVLKIIESKPELNHAKNIGKSFNEYILKKSLKKPNSK